MVSIGSGAQRPVEDWKLGGTMPENLPVAENIKKVEGRERKRLKAEQKKLSENQSRQEV
jgi:hypothetical protein